ncbi:hypothetical protein RE428_10420 [Marinobacter nanhaiticus D15-8W]|uniref:Uncharacterized protein n=1 Tax=Marinobacter nanhaiticus D15-8W TaxID=626887 RepID=N6VR71_9GAMM|nr:hypothetical protein [Marinobacter nanhaiticus]ENO12685.1 hypothetical protein J057_14825 [Marinobacter nanhaiticus D15-8W]BES70024.1 hypothetical protein RE428_10420 [Marinobacter nanhaiticus D15-8W]
MTFSALDIGIVISALLASVGYLYKLGVEKRQSARYLLFHLLEIRHELSLRLPRSDHEVEKLQEDFRAVVGERTNLLKIVDMLPKTELGAMLGTVTNGLNRVDSSLLDSYEVALANYARIDPFLTHRLRGMKLIPKLSKNLDSTLSSFRSLPGLAEDDPDTQKVASYGARQLNREFDDTRDGLLAKLDQLILSVGREAGLFMWFRAWRVLSQAEEENSNEQEVSEAQQAALGSAFKTLMIEVLVQDESIKGQLEAAPLEEMLDAMEEKLGETVS